MADSQHKPRFRPGIVVAQQQENSQRYLLIDQLRISPTLTLSPLYFQWLRLFNGQRTIAEIYRLSQIGMVGIAELHRFVDDLDECFLLEGPRFDDLLFGPIRRPSCIGCYSEDEREREAQFAELFTAEGGPGLPGPPGCRLGRDGPVRGVLVPHMDYGRGGTVYGWGFKEIVERTNADLFIIIATSHYSAERFSLTRQHFATPLGVVETDQRAVDRLEELYGPGLFQDPIAHIPEHSIELEVVLLQHLLKKPFRILPLLVGSFGDCIERKQSPLEQPEIRRMAESLRTLESEWGQSVGIIISGDLAHIGPKFGDPDPLNESQLADSRQKDERIVQSLESAQAADYFSTIAGEADQRRICGLPPTTLFLESFQPSRGKVLAYKQYIEKNGHESVSFASAAFS